MKSKLRRIAMILCFILIFTSMQFWDGTATFADKTSWEDSLVQVLTNNNKTPQDKFNEFSIEHPYAADWILQDSDKLNLSVERVFSGDISSIVRLVQSVDESANQDSSIQDLISKYARGAEDRANSRLTNLVKSVSNQFIVVKHKQLGGSHYAYTEGLSDDKNSPDGNESNFDPDSEMVLLTIESKDNRIERKEEVLLSSKEGVIRDPDVSEDGTKVLYSYKENKVDDYHLYEMVIATKEIRQLTFGPGLADIEPKYLDNGNIVFNSTRITQTVDCWKTPVSNIFICDGDGKNIRRIGFDQVHTTYPTVTSDGRILYTRWDYNDRSQMFVQSIFQMYTDGTNQTELFGNDMNFPTTLAHTREIPGETAKYYSIALGHHTLQAGKLVKLDLTKGRNNPDSVEFVFPDRFSKKDDSVDGFGQQGPMYKFPYAINDNEVLVSFAPNGYAKDKRETPYGIYYMNVNGDRELLSASKDGKIGASQVVPIKKHVLFQRPDLVNYNSATGNYYVGNVYAGEGLKGIEPGTAKYLRIVALKYRTSAIGANQAKGEGSADPYSPVSAGNGAWDIKQVLGIVPVYEDGSALFKAPAGVPIYFQVLNDKGEIIQSMRSWTTLMPNETFSCVGCHEDKNTVPPMNSTPTMAMNNGISEITPDLWQTGEGYTDYDPYTDYKGFSYMKEIQPILDKSCISCHNNKDVTIIGGKVDVDIKDTTPIFEIGADWKYLTEEQGDWMKSGFNDSAWKSGNAPFGREGTPPGGSKTKWEEDKIYLRKEFNMTQQQINSAAIILNIAYDENPIVYINGEQVFQQDAYTQEYKLFNITSELKGKLKPGKNIIAVFAENKGGGQFIDLGLYISNASSNKASGPVSLESDPVYASREKRNYPLSYIVLTGSRWNGQGIQFLADSTNKYTNWISGMSTAVMLKPYEFGSSKSNLIKRLREGHGNLSDAEIRRIATWIDLSVPLIGEYNEQTAWSANDLREFEEKGNKRAYFDMLNMMSIRALKNGGSYPDSRELTIKYFKKDEEIGKVTGKGLVQLIGNKKLQAGDKIRVELPQGEKYFYFNLDTRVKEALIYVPDGVFEYSITTDITKTMPATLNSRSDMAFAKPMISARIATQEDMDQVKNLALNPYDKDGSANIFPHVTASNTYGDGKNPEFAPRNAIDGFRNNLGHGNYPVQSWGPDNVNDLWLNVDFGREVEVNSVTITIRADFPHDTYFKSATLEFSDGTKQDITLKKTGDPQVIAFNSTKTTSVKLTNLKKASGTWASITEFEVFGK